LNLLLKFNKQTVWFKTYLSFCDRASDMEGDTISSTRPTFNIILGRVSRYTPWVAV